MREVTGFRHSTQNAALTLIQQCIEFINKRLNFSRIGPDYTSLNTFVHRCEANSSGGFWPPLQCYFAFARGTVNASVARIRCASTCRRCASIGFDWSLSTAE